MLRLMFLIFWGFILIVLLYLKLNTLRIIEVIKNGGITEHFAYNSLFAEEC